jgi:hypothetical protein
MIGDSIIAIGSIQRRAGSLRQRSAEILVRVFGAGNDKRMGMHFSQSEGSHRLGADAASADRKLPATRSTRRFDVPPELNHVASAQPGVA